MESYHLFSTRTLNPILEATTKGYMMGLETGPGTVYDGFVFRGEEGSLG